MLTALERAICFCWYNMTKMAWSVTHGFIHMLRVPKERTSAPSRSRYPATTWSSEQHLSPMVRFMFGCWFFFFFIYELNLMKALVPASNNVSFSPGRCWMDALELALSCSSLYKLTAKAGREADISTSSESSHILHLLQSTALSDTELLQ